MSRHTKRKNPMRPLGMWRDQKALWRPRCRWRGIVRAMMRERLHVPLSEATVADCFVAWSFFHPRPDVATLTRRPR